MPQLAILNGEINAPILIATSKYDEDEHHEAVKNGAFFYGQYCDEPEKNIYAVTVTIENYNRTKKQRTEMNILTYSGILISLSQRKTFVNDAEVELTKKEFEVLFYFMSNRGRALSYEQIYCQVWEEEYADDISNEAVKNIIKRLRKKIINEENENKIIENIRGFGYKMPM